MFTIRHIIFISSLFITFNSVAQDKLNVLIDADSGNEVDDPYALVRALIEPTWNITAINATHWQTSHWAIDETMENSHRVNQTILGFFDSSIPTKRGGVARMYDWGDQAQHSAAAYEIIKQVNSLLPGQKLEIVALGALTNVASAVYIQPEISDQIRLHWLGSTYDFEKGILRKNDFNCMMDIQALDLLLFSDVEMHIIPVNIAAQMQFDYDEAFDKLSDSGRVGKFLLDRWDNHLDGGRNERVIWDLALITGIIHPEWIEKETILTSKDNGGREIQFIKDIDEKAIIQDFYTTLSEWNTNR